MHGERVRMWRVMVVDNFKVLSRYYSGDTEEKYENFTQDIR